MSQADLLIEAIDALERAGVGWMLTGSLVSSLQGEPRATHDVDIVAEVERGAMGDLARSFSDERYRFDEAMAREALARRGMFSVLDTRSGDKVDFWPLIDDPFDASRFSRRVAVLAFGRSVWVSSPEDTILQKLKWAKASGGSERQLNDAAGVYEVNAATLDQAYMRDWADRLGVSDLLAGVRTASLG